MQWETSSFLFLLFHKFSRNEEKYLKNIPLILLDLFDILSND